MNYLVFQVGCIECDVSSYPIKVCNTLDEAINCAENHPSTWDSEGGEGFVTIIDLKECKDIFYIRKKENPYKLCPIHNKQYLFRCPECYDGYEGETK